MHYRVEEFKDLQRVKLPKDIADRDNLFRKEVKVEGMSTLEAIAHCMGVLECKNVKEHLLNAYKLKKRATLIARGVKRSES